MTCLGGGQHATGHLRSASRSLLLGPLLALFFAFWSFLTTLFKFCCLSCRSWLVCCASGSGFRSPGTYFRAFGTSFGAPRAMFFQVCSCTHTCNANTAREAFCIGKTNTKRMSATLLVSHKAKKNRSYGYLKRTPGQSSLRI